MALFQQNQFTNGCCTFLRWPSRGGYRMLTTEEGEGEMLPSSSSMTSAVRVVVGREKRLFLVDPTVLAKEPFRVLMDAAGTECGRDDELFVDVDAILFEHMLWLVYNDCAASSTSLFQLNLREIIDFYSQDY